MFALVCRFIIPVIVVFSAGPVQAGTFWFPIDAHYPYSSYLTITAVPDLDPANHVIKTRRGELGYKSDGCLVDGAGACPSRTVTADDVWGYKKSGGGTWNIDGLPYTDGVSPTGKEYMWYDNHRGYDFVPSASYGNKTVHAVEDGYIVAISDAWGQVTIEHTIGGTKYRTTYTHMNKKTGMAVGQFVARWFELGTVSNVTPPGYSVDVHLHFVTQKKVGTAWVTVDPYGQIFNNVQVESYLWQ